MISKKYLQENYLIKGKSTKEIAKALGYSETGVTYWLKKHNINKRSISEAIYLKANPQGDPFKFRNPKTDEEWFLFGLGLGLYWGEGNKANKHAVRLGNSDPALVQFFIKFLVEIYKVDKSKFRFGLQIFSDTPQKDVINFWCNQLNISKEKFYKVIVTKSGKTGTYKNKNQYGVLTVYFSNKKLRDSIVGAINRLQAGKLPT